MYAFVSGKAESVFDNAVIIENGGIGYLINVSLQTATVIQKGSQVKLYTYLHVKEDVFALYGFMTLEEKSLFEKLISVSGIGPKMAMQALGGYNAASLASMIASGDIASLCKIKGLGRKTAERIVLELQETINAEIAQAPSAEETEITLDGEEAVFALISLGLKKSEAQRAVKEAMKAVSGTENIVAYVLRNLK
ncbi:MAG: Holliday junction branch migration protein RuvA [Clostridiales bacterium]|nr:Holliday junction branch migration protein RuvA [Clostridiales bacterium]